MATDRARARRPRSQAARILRRASFVILLAFILLVGAIRVYPLSYLYPSLPRITHTSRGAAGDPLNVLLIGSKERLSASFTQAGWLTPDPITPETSARIAADSLAHRPYPTAPVSNLYVFGRSQDLAFERPTDDVQNRGHIRLWLAPLQVDGQPVWLGAASYDHGIELSGASGLPTHHISPAVDLERDALGMDLARTGLVAATSYAPYSSPIFVAYNGGGDYYTSDGEALVISLSPVTLTLPDATGGAAVMSGLIRGLFHAYAVVITTLPLTVAALAGLALLLGLAFWPIAPGLRRRVRGA